MYRIEDVGDPGFVVDNRGYDFLESAVARSASPAAFASKHGSKLHFPFEAGSERERSSRRDWPPFCADDDAWKVFAEKHNPDFREAGAGQVDLLAAAVPRFSLLLVSEALDAIDRGPWLADHPALCPVGDALQDLENLIAPILAGKPRDGQAARQTHSSFATQLHAIATKIDLAIALAGYRRPYADGESQEQSAAEERGKFCFDLWQRGYSYKQINEALTQHPKFQNFKTPYTIRGPISSWAKRHGLTPRKGKPGPRRGHGGSIPRQLPPQHANIASFDIAEFIAKLLDRPHRDPLR